jgi:hypothetical protein
MQRHFVQVRDNLTGTYHTIHITSVETRQSFIGKYTSSLRRRNRLNPICRGYNFIVDGEEIVTVTTPYIPPAIFNKITAGVPILAMEDSIPTSALEAIDYALVMLRRAKTDRRDADAHKAEDLFRRLTVLERTERHLKSRIHDIGRILFRTEDFGEILIVADELRENVASLWDTGSAAVELLRVNPLI